ncbi:MAG TPA: hypothetical protein VFB22_00480 [Candidatus Baltobacteraceae bacterium]|nr:hypothetical protein [Candidatus Baltobacteraceae bacterium]
MAHVASRPHPELSDAAERRREAAPQLLRAALAVAGPMVPAWQRDCIEALRGVAGIDLRVVAVGGRTPPPAPRCSALQLTPVASEPGTIADADVVFDFTGGALAADAPLGVWSLRLGAADDWGLPFVREIAAGATFEIGLVRRSGRRRERMRTARFALGRWYPSTVRLALRSVAGWPAAALAMLRDGIPLAAEGDEAPDAAPPRPRERAAFVAKLAAKLANEALQQSFEVVEWNCGIVDGGAAAILADAPLAVRWLPRPPRGTFIADPFVVERDGVRAMLVEHFDYEVGRGVIDALILDDRDEVVARRRAIEAETHLSYPYPLEIEGDLYVVPENCAGKEVALYRCVAFPDRWARETVVLPFDGVDTTIFRHDDRWWALCTRHSGGSTLALHAFHASSPRGPWLPHALNPIVVDVTCGRPAGAPFTVEGVLYRPGQDCARSYGAGLTIARVDELTPWSYRETVVRRIDASSFGRWRDGVHTLAFTRGRAVVDGKRAYADPRKLRWMLRRVREKLRGA